MIRSGPKCGTIKTEPAPAKNQPVEEFVVNAFINIGTRSLIETRFFPALVAGIAGVGAAVAGVTWGGAMIANSYQQLHADDGSSYEY